MYAAAKVAFDGIRGGCPDFLHFPVSGHREAKSYGEQRRDASIQTTGRNARDSDDLCRTRMADRVHCASRGSGVRGAMLCIFELRTVLEAVSRAGSEGRQL